MNNSTQPLVSICIPCYNAGEYIQETLKSVFSQTYQNIKVIVCDDRSTDNSVEKIKEFHDPRLKLVINPKNLGQFANYNNALSHAVGKYVKLLCADDIIAPECIAKQVHAFEMHSDDNVVLVTSNKKNIIDAQGKRIFSMQCFAGKGLFEGKKIIKKAVHRGNIIGEPGATLMQVEALRKIPVMFHEDLDLWLKILVYGNLFVMDDVVFNFRIPSTSWTSTHSWYKSWIYISNFLDKWQKNPDFELTKFDIVIGKTIALFKTVARVLFVRWVLRKNRE
jgi:glycosyltransferase involved in cell wall biosynthesis